MPITAEHAGRRYPPTRAYEVSAAKIAEFAAALGDASPAYRGTDPVAPPTFAAVVVAPAWQQLFDDPELGLALRRIMHADQRFSWSRPLRPGDQVRATLVIDQVRVRAGTEMISSTAQLAVGDDVVCTAQATFWHNREQG